MTLWLGGSDSITEGTFVWDGSGVPTSFTNWSPNNPDNAGGDQDCVRMWLDIGQWDDAWCNATVLATMCETIFSCN